MTTAREICVRALRKIGVVARDETPSDADAATTLDDLNMMLHAWKLSGVDIQHTDMMLGSDFPLAPEFVEGTVHMLAGRIAPEYPFPPRFDPDDFFRKIQAAYIQVPDVAIPDSLTILPSARWGRYRSL